jgi:hypothetical protein
MALEIMAKNPLPISIQIAIMYAGILITIVSGIAMLKRQNRARFLYIIWGAVSFVIGILTSPIKVAMIPSVVIFVIIVFFLFRPKANEYFSTKDTKNRVQNL